MSDTKLMQQRQKTRLKLATRLTDLPMLPMLLARLSMMDPASDEFANHVEVLANSDPTFATKLLRLANKGSPKKKQLGFDYLSSNCPGWRRFAS